jgi:phosphocarrier protein FPr/phosphocarrier protein
MGTPGSVEIRAPLSGVIVSLDSVPDPVFARKMLGDGVAIDPTSSEVLAPISGQVTQLHRAHHALAITSDDGVEVLIHVGLDTVSLEGVGFTPLVPQGARVERGDPVLRFDADVVAGRARSLITPVVVTSGEKVARLTPASGLAEAGSSVLMQLELAAEGAAREPEAGETVRSGPVRLPNPEGLHARPAAVLAAAAKKYAARIRLARDGEEVNAKSVVAIMELSTRQGEAVHIHATGPDGPEAVAELTRLLEAGCGEGPAEAPPAPTAPPRPAAAARPVPSAPGELTGVPASPGLAIGRVFQHRHVGISVQEAGGTPEEELARLAAATREAARQVEALKQHSADLYRAQILHVHLALLEDPELVEPTEALVGEGKSAAFAWQQAFTSHASKLEGLGNPLLRERAADVRDVGRRLLALLAGVEQTPIVVPEGSILIADELTPSDTAAFDRSRVLGFCTTTGGSTSHVAIIARSMGIPAVCGIDEAALALTDGARVVIDGTHGILKVSPEEKYLTAVRERVARQVAQREAEKAAAFAQAQTRDGHRVEVVANIKNAKDAREAMARGAEGVGLLRSEFLFMDREAAPSEEEQAAAYTGVAEAVGRGRPIVIRTLDVGGDKPLPYLPLPKEANPFLGLRGIRVSLEYPEMFRTQLRAILRVAPLGDVHVMFPMIATLDEVRAAKQVLAEAQRAVPHAVKVGLMIEVPSAAVIAEVLAREVDFFSIGTNDLTQYTLAMDRGHPVLARYADALHPAVLRMVALTVEGAHEHGKWVGVCGGIASDVLAVPLLTGLGVDELSVDVPSIASVKATLARWSMDECDALATEALRQRTTAEVRALLADRAEEAEPSPAERVLP